MAGRTHSTILDVAVRSAGVCTRAELRRAGVPDRTITRQVASGLLVRVGSGIYQVPSLASADSPIHRAAKALPAATVSHLSAARLWGLPVAPPETEEPVHLSVDRSATSRSTLPGVVVHRTRRWSATDLAEARAGLRVTSPARTIVDLAGTALTDRRLQHVVQTAVVAGQTTLAEVAACLERCGGRGSSGAGRLRRLLVELDDGEPLPESELERRVADLLGPGFRRQYRPPWYDGRRGVVDFADPVARVVVEADGRRWHATSQAMIEDRRRDRAAAANGWLVLRVAWTDVLERPTAVAGELAAIVATRRRAIA
jgi:very-short-patch-repair endonuclease/predicted transcriptional regulator of viral defense system